LKISIKRKRMGYWKRRRGERENGEDDKDGGRTRKTSIVPEDQSAGGVL
jgi:hypothetical protein